MTMILQSEMKISNWTDVNSHQFASRSFSSSCGVFLILAQILPLKWKMSKLRMCTYSRDAEEDSRRRGKLDTANCENSWCFRFSSNTNFLKQYQFLWWVMSALREGHQFMLVSFMITIFLRFAYCMCELREHDYRFLEGKVAIWTFQGFLSFSPIFLIDSLRLVTKLIVMMRFFSRRLFSYSLLRIRAEILKHLYKS